MSILIAAAFWVIHDATSPLTLNFWLSEESLGLDDTGSYRPAPAHGLKVEHH